jgi:hypothetical protein
MQGLVNLALEFAKSMGVLVGAICYIMALFSFLYAIYGFRQQASPANPYVGRPWVPFVSLLLSGVFSSFPAILTKANVSVGSSIVVSMGNLTSYTQIVVNNNVMGNSPGQAVVNIVQMFQLFFQTFGAMCCLFAVIRCRSIINNEINQRMSGCLVQFVFGILLINVLSVAQALENILQA